MEHDDPYPDVLSRSREKLAAAEAARHGAWLRLKEKALTARAMLVNARISSTLVARQTGLSPSAIRKLAADGDDVGWRPPSLRTCEAIDRYAAEKLRQPLDLTKLRSAYDAADQAVNSAKREKASAEAKHDLHVPFQLPAAPTGFVGRREELSSLVSWIREPSGRTQPPALVIASIDGMAGVGKSALAIHLAHRLRDRFGDGLLYTDLRGADATPARPIDVLARFIRALGGIAGGGGDVPDLAEAVATYRTLLAGRRVLVVLDNATDAAQVRPLLPTAPSCRAVVTSRSPLADLDNARFMTLQVLSDRDAVHLLEQLIGRERARAEPEAVTLLARQCGYLPLALRVVGAHLRHRKTWSVADAAGRLQDKQHRLTRIQVGDQSVRASFQLTYDHLTAEEARTFRLLSLFDGEDAGAELVSRVSDVSADQAHTVLERLVDLQLLETPRYRRYRYHDLMRLFARERAAAEESVRACQDALARACVWYLEQAKAAEAVLESGGVDGVPGGGFAGRSAALAWLESERANLVAAVQQAVGASVPAVAWDLAWALFDFYDLRKYWLDWQAVNETALAAARQAGDRGAQAAVLNHLGVVYKEQRRFDRARRCLTEALAIRQERGERSRQGVVLMNLGLVEYTARNYPAAAERMRQSLAIHQETGDREGMGQVLANLGTVATDVGKFDEAAAQHYQALEIFRELGDRRGEAITLHNLGVVDRNRGRLDEATAYMEQSIPIREQVDDQHGMALTHAVLGQIAREQRRYAAATRWFARAMRLFRKVGDDHNPARVCYDQAELFRAAGQPEAAARRYERAAALFHARDDQQEEGKALLGLGRAVAATRGVAAARPHWTKALELLEQAAAPEASEARDLLQARGAP